MDIRFLPTQSLKDFLQLIRECLEVDDAITSGPKRYGVREQFGWLKDACRCEAELESRGEPFVPIDWYRTCHEPYRSRPF